MIICLLTVVAFLPNKNYVHNKIINYKPNQIIENNEEEMPLFN